MICTARRESFGEREVWQIMKLTIEQVVEKLDLLGSVIKWARQYDVKHASEDELDLTGANVQLPTKVEL